MNAYRPFPAPSLWRVVVLVLIVALVCNCFLWSLVSRDEAFARVIAIASGIAAIGLIVHRFVWERLMGEALLLSFAVWTANAIEYATFDRAVWESQVRQCGFYSSFALLSLGAYVATRERTP